MSVTLDLSREFKDPAVPVLLEALLRFGAGAVPVEVGPRSKALHELGIGERRARRLIESLSQRGMLEMRPKLSPKGGFRNYVSLKMEHPWVKELAAECLS